MIVRYLLAAVAIAIVPWVVPNDFFLRLAQDVAYLAIGAIGLNILIGLSGQLSLGQAGFFAVGAYGSGVMALNFGWPLGLSIPFALLLTLIVAAAVSLIALRTRTHYLAMATLAFGFIAGIVVQRWVGVTGGAMGLIGVPQLQLGGGFNDGPARFFWLAAATCLVVQILSDYVMGSEWGRRLHAVKESESFAAVVGINVPVWRAVTFIAAAMAAGLSGVFFVHQSSYISSDAFGLDRSISFLIMVVVGGLGLRYGAMIGAVVLVALYQLTAGLYDYAYFIFGTIFLGVMLLFPAGAAGALSLLWQMIANRMVRVHSTDQTDVGQVVRQPWLSGALSNVASTAAGPLLELRGVSKSYAGVRAVDTVDIAVAAGSVHALIGPNGAGKSTLINVISGLYRCDAGEIYFNGQDVTALAAHQRCRLGLARTFQNLQLIGTLTAAENVMLGLARRRHFLAGLLDWLAGGKAEAELRNQALSLLAFFGIERFADHLPGDLAYGHRKLIEMARALGQNPSLMLLDEPIAGLNEEEAAEIARVVHRLKEHGITTLVVEHNMPFVMGISDRISVLDYGRKIGEGRPEEVQANQAVIGAYLGTGGDEAAA